MPTLQSFLLRVGSIQALATAPVEKIAKSQVLAVAESVRVLLDTRKCAVIGRRLRQAGVVLEERSQKNELPQNACWTYLCLTNS